MKPRFLHKRDVAEFSVPNIMIIPRGLLPLLSFTFLLLISVFGLQPSVGVIGPTPEAECAALLRLPAKQRHTLSTNCTCTNQLQDARIQLMQCDGSCAAVAAAAKQEPQKHAFAGCSSSGDEHSVSQLHLSNMGLQGDLSWIAEFEHIELLDVSSNNLNGTVPHSLWRLGELTHVNLSFNSFNGHLSVNSSASHVQILDLSHNQIRGALPQNLCTSFPNLIHLRVSNNNLAGHANLSLCRRLEYLDASSNRLQGPLLQGLAAITAMKSVDVKENHLLNGSIPNLSAFPELIHFDASFNNLSGILGAELPPKLSSINVSHNNLQVDLSTSKILSFGLDSFWPNKACNGCPTAAMAPSPSPYASELAHKGNHVFKKARHNTIIGIVVGSCSTVILITGICCILILRRRQRPKWPPPHGLHKMPTTTVPFMHAAAEYGPFAFNSRSGTWIANVKDPSSVPVVIFKKPLLNMTFADLIRATKSFDKEFEVGDGMGLVYACILPEVAEENGAKVAIKVVEDGGHSLSNEAAQVAFAAMGKVRHDNLVPLLGYCIVGEEKLLMYKHMEGGSLEDALHEDPKGAPLTPALTDAATSMEDWSNMESWPEEDESNQSCAAILASKPCLDWKTRHNIALGVARALAYLHNGCHRPIVHGAVSSSSIFLGVSTNEVRLANYGGAWGLPQQPMPGYMAPECRQTAHVPTSHLSVLSAKCRESIQVVAVHSSKCDVYGMGVVLLELVTGRRAVGNHGGAASAVTLVAWIRRLMKGKRVERAVDPKLLASAGDSSDLPKLLEMIKLGYLCTADSPSKRPSMQQVVGLLKDLG